MNCDRCKESIARGYLINGMIECLSCAERSQISAEDCVEVVDGDFAQGGTIPSTNLRREAKKLGADLGEQPERFGTSWLKPVVERMFREQPQPDADVMGYLHSRFGVEPEFSPSPKRYWVWLKSVSMQFYRYEGAWSCDLNWHDEWTRHAPRLKNNRHTGGHDTLYQCADEAARLAVETLRSDLDTLEGDDGR